MLSVDWLWTVCVIVGHCGEMFCLSWVTVFVATATVRQTVAAVIVKLSEAIGSDVGTMLLKC